MKLSYNKWMNFLIFLHFTFLPFGFLNFGSSYLNINFITSILFIISVNSSLVKIFRINYASKMAICLFLYWLYLVFISFFNYRNDVITAFSELRTQTLYIFTFFAMFVYFHENSNKIYLVNKYVKFGLLLLIILSILGIGVETTSDEGRISTFGMNSNLISYFLLYFIFLNLSYFTEKSIKNKLLGFVYIVLALFLMSKLASLSALFILLFGIVIYFLFKRIPLLVKIRVVFFTIILTSFISFLMLNSDVYSKRLSDKENLENLSSRKGLWELALSNIENNYLFGVGVFESAADKKSVLFLELSYHNVYLDILVNTGLIGFMFFLGFYFYYLTINWKIYKMSGETLFIVFSIIPALIIFSGQFSFAFFLYILSSVWFSYFLTKYKSRFIQ